MQIRFRRSNGHDCHHVCCCSGISFYLLEINFSLLFTVKWRCTWNEAAESLWGLLAIKWREESRWKCGLKWSEATERDQHRLRLGNRRQFITDTVGCLLSSALSHVYTVRICRLMSKKGRSLFHLKRWQLHFTGLLPLSRPSVPPAPDFAARRWRNHFIFPGQRIRLPSTL